MTQATKVLKLSEGEARSLETRLRDGLPPDAEWRSVPHARFSVKALGVVATCYASGKLVLQGKDLETFQARFVEGGKPVSSSKSAGKDDAELTFTVPTVGSDEAGKGDFFGPLVVSACFAPPDRLAELEKIGVTDSKRLSDQRALRLAELIEDAFDCATVRLDPPEYNARFDEIGNSNPVLAALHARAIRTLVARNPEVGSIVVDRFGREELVEDALRAVDVSGIELIQTPRAERHPVVAAASIVARAAFLEGLAACEESCGTDLHKGAGEPVDVAARRVVRIGGRELLGRVAKLHFRNTERAGPGAR